MVTADITLYKESETGQVGVSGLFMDIIPVTIQFRAVVTGGIPTGFLWDFGDGSTSIWQDPIHTYMSYGTHRVVLTVSDLDGSYVSPFYEVKLGKLDFIASVVKGIPPLTVNFGDQSVAPSGCHFTGTMWDFGDGSTGMASNPLHTYYNVGKYTVTLSSILSDV